MPRDMDWSEGYPDKWEYYEAQTCSECGAVVINGDDHKEDCPEYNTDCRDMGSEGPMMNYLYPLPLYGMWVWRGDRAEKVDALEAARAIADLPLCIVTNDSGEDGLALTGGGMDLSWEICEAYMRLGYLPPLHYCRLPNMAGKPLNARNKWILAGCRRSAQIAVSRARWAIKDLMKLKADMSKQPA